MTYAPDFLDSTGPNAFVRRFLDAVKRRDSAALMAMVGDETGPLNPARMADRNYAAGLFAAFSLPGYHVGETDDDWFLRDEVTVPLIYERNGARTIRELQLVRWQDDWLLVGPKNHDPFADAFRRLDRKAQESA